LGLHEQADLAEWSVDAPAELATMLREGASEPTVWHLHGYIHDAARLVLTPDGFDELYGDGKTRESVYPAALHVLRTVMTSRTLLFIGFSLDDQHFGDQMRLMDRIFKKRCRTPLRSPPAVVDATRQGADAKPTRHCAVRPLRRLRQPLLELVRYLGSLANPLATA